MRLIYIIMILAVVQLSASAQPGAAELAGALEQSEAELEICRDIVDSLQRSLKKTETLYESRNEVADTLVSNLRQQKAVQDSAITLLKQNADTLDLMVEDYAAKLDELNNLYVKELEKSTRPWFLTRKGLTGMLYGLVSSAAIILAVGVVDVVD